MVDEPSPPPPVPVPAPPVERPQTSDSGGDDSSKENKESTSDDNGKNAKRRGGTKQKWVPLEIEHKPERSNRRGRGDGGPRGRRRGPPLRDGGYEGRGPHKDDFRDHKGNTIL